jgi:hypothetical protein
MSEKNSTEPTVDLVIDSKLLDVLRLKTIEYPSLDGFVRNEKHTIGAVFTESYLVNIVNYIDGDTALLNECMGFLELANQLSPFYSSPPVLTIFQSKTRTTGFVDQVVRSLYRARTFEGDYESLSRSLREYFLFPSGDTKHTETNKRVFENNPFLIGLYIFMLVSRDPSAV